LTEAPMSLQVLVDADNVAPSRLQPVLDLLAALPGVELVASGRAQALDALDWPSTARLTTSHGWQRADVSLAESYRPDHRPLVLVTGDGDFGLLAARHAGPVLVISGAPSSRLRGSATVVDPAMDGLEPIRRWLTATGVSGAAE
jgi:hypothetical protein